MARYSVGAAFVTLMMFASASVAEPFRYPEGACDHGELKHVHDLPVLTVWGSPAEIGAAVGKLAVRHAGAMNSYPHNLLKRYHLLALWKPLVKAGRTMVEHFPAEYREELEAIVKPGEIERDQAVAGNTMFDLKKVLACSALLVESERSETGGPLLGRNLDYPSLGYAHEYTLITVYHPAHAQHAFVSVGFPGMVGCLSGMNDAGLALAVLEVFQLKAGHKRFDSSGWPYALCYRRLLEECSTIDEAKARLKQMPRVTITNLVIADRNRVAVFEVTPREVLVRPLDQGTCVCTNHYRMDEVKPLVPINVFHTRQRFQALSEAVQRHDKFDIDDLHESLHRAAMKKDTLQTMIFEPATLRLHLAIGALPASAGELKVLDLKPLFEQ